MTQSEAEVTAMCKEIESKYSCCDVADALLVLKIPNAGTIVDLAPIPRPATSTPSARIVAPLSTLLFVPKSHSPTSSSSPSIPAPNIPPGTHFTDCPSAGSTVLMQCPSNTISALLGDIVATRFRTRGLRGALVDGRVRDLPACAELCADGRFAVWAGGYSSVGTSLEAKAWAVDVPLTVGGVEVRPGDLVVLEEAERGVVVIPRDRLGEVVKLLGELKEADEGVLAAVREGVGMGEALAKWPGHYIHRS